MNRIAGIIVRPRRQWDEIARDPTPLHAMLVTLLALCLIPTVAIMVGMSVFNTGWNPTHGYSPIGPPLVVAIANYLSTVGTLLLLAAIFRWLAVAPGKPRKSFVRGLNVAVYGAAPALLAGALLVLPVMVIAVLVAALHSLYLFSAGLQQVHEVEAGESTMLVAMCIVVLSLAAGVIGAIAAALGLI